MNPRSSNESEVFKVFYMFGCVVFFAVILQFVTSDIKSFKYLNHKYQMYYKSYHVQESVTQFLLKVNVGTLSLSEDRMLLAIVLYKTWQHWRIQMKLNGTLRVEAAGPEWLRGVCGQKLTNALTLAALRLRLPPGPARAKNVSSPRILR